MSRWLPLLALLAVGLMSCGPEGQSGARAQIRATFEDEQPAVDAAVLLNGEEAGRTDSNGQLTLELPSGHYQVELHQNAGGGLFSRAVQSLELGRGPQEVKVNLPRPVRMLEPLEVTTSRVHLAWEASTERSFREYKVYASHSPAFDETTGQLVYVGTEASQTDYRVVSETGFIRLISADSHIYFRVFVLKEDGSLAGSNILHVRTPRWDNERHFTRFYRLSVERTFAGSWPIHGVAHDGGALWFLYRQEVGGYYDNDKLTLIQRDPETLKVLKEIAFEDYRVPWGLTWDGASLWVYLGAPSRLVSFNPVTGAREQGFVASAGTESLAWTGSHLLQSKGYVDARIERIDPVTGGAAGSLPNPFTQLSGHRATGIAYRPGEIWLSDMWESDIVIIDDAGVHIGVVSDTSHFSHMTFMGERLVGVTRDSQVHIMRLEP